MKNRHMIRLSDLRNIVEEQRSRMPDPLFIKRKLFDELSGRSKSHALIVSGVRRCGKSTLLKQFAQSSDDEWFYINFDTTRLYDFATSDFEILDALIKEFRGEKLFFDEIQVVDGWEVFVRQKLDDGYRVWVTGSNASLLSREMGTKLTGRNLRAELFPFSYEEFLDFTESHASSESLVGYLKLGGFPEYLSEKDDQILRDLFEDILFRDIAVRFGIRDIRSLKRLAVFLISNVGRMVSANRLVSQFEVKSSATILEYISYLELSYLVELIPKFSFSIKKQQVHPRKVYAIDNGMIDAVSPSFSPDYGRKLENAVFLALRRSNANIYYFNEQQAECDFVLSDQEKVTQVIQVCYQLDYNNRQREEKGLMSAMEYFELDEGLIVTLDQEDYIKVGGKTIRVIPFWKWVTQP